MGRRLPGRDYRRRGCYVITIVLEDRRSNALGELAVKDPRSGGWLALDEAKALALEPESVEAKVVFSELGKAIFGHFRKIGEFTPGLKPVYCAIMPDHVHLLLEVEKELARPLGHAIAGFKTGCGKLHAKLGGEGRLFAAGFVDETIFRAGQLHAEFEYLLDNPRRLAVKKLFPGLFKYSREIRVDLRLAPQEHDGREGAQKIAPQEHDGPEGAQKIAQTAAGAHGPRLARPLVRTAPTVQTVGRFSALGNHFLLQRPLAQVQVSRALFRYRRIAKPGAKSRIARDAQGEPIVEFSSPGYARRRDALLAEARRGAVLISPCISDGERQIAREALAAGCRLITMQNKGFSKLQKPAGRYFDACAEGRLLMLAPGAWPYRPGEKPMTRLDATAMNRLCQWLAGDGAAEIDYHGMTPNDIDRIAMEAVKRCD